MSFAYIWGVSASVLASCISMFFRWENREERLKKHRKLSNFFALLSALPLIALAAIELNNSTVCFGEYEIGYAALVKLFGLFSDNYNIFFGIISAVTVGIFYWIIYRESENPAFSIILFFLSCELFSIADNSKLFLSIAVLITAIPLIKEGAKNWLYVILITVVAISIDNTAIAAIPFYLLYIWTPQAWISGFIILAMYPLGLKLYPADTGIDIIHFALNLIAFILMMIVVGKIEKKKTNERIFYCTTIFEMSSALFTSTATPSPLLIVYIPSIIRRIRTDWVRYFVYFLTLLVFAALFVFVSINNNFAVLNFETFLIA